MMDDVTERKSDRLSQKVAGRRLYGMIYKIPLIVIAALAGLQAALLHPALIHQCLLCFICILMSVFTQNKTFQNADMLMSTLLAQIQYTVCGLSDFQLKKEEKTH